ncbi:MAG: MBL fold metallo-hydrolase [Bacteriovoracaceae bacterium]|nr:MBL fold metallo-hydrolase [Bacteriovoracaceae bacterium]
MDIKIETFPMGSFACNCSFIYSEKTREAIIIDPGNDGDTLMKEIESRNLIVKKLLHTHAHFDHIGCSKEIKKKTGAEIHLHKKDGMLYTALPAQAMMFGQAPLLAGKVDKWIEDEEEYSLEDSGLKNFMKSLHTPGHTEGSCCFYTEIQDEPLLFSGDTLFNQSIGRTDLPGGSFDVIKSSIENRLYTLPDETKVITGHGPTTRIYEEKKTNPFVSGS